MVRVSTFVGMSEDDIGANGVHEARERPGDAGQPEGSLLILPRQ